MRGFISLIGAASLASAAPFTTSTIHEGSAPVLSSTNSVEVPDNYIVVFKKHVTDASAAVHQAWVQEAHAESENVRTELRKRSQLPLTNNIFEGIKHMYNIGDDFKGYSGHFDDSLVELVRNHPDVEYIEKDSIVHTLGESEGETEKNAPWGLARISHRDSLSFGTFNKYLYAEDAGEGVDVYVIDTGTNTEHVDFEGRAHWGKTIPSGDTDVDGNGHGTHCSGTVAGKKYGVAKKANVYAVKVLRTSGSGTMSDVIKGVEWAATSHVEKAKKGKKGFKGSAANMSLGGGKSPALDRAVNGAVAAGIHFAVAAGNDNADSCSYSPAAAENAITVGASGIDDSRAYFSNFGPCNDIFAPGLSILSAWIGSKYAVNTISGTSMASPHVAGLLAYYLSLQPDSDSAYAVEKLTPKKLKQNIIDIGTVGALTDVPSDTENVLIWNGGGSSNYSSIIKAGSYTVKKNNKAAKLPTTIELLQDAVEKDFESVSGKASKFASKAEKFSQKIHDEIKDFVEELSS